MAAKGQSGHHHFIQYEEIYRQHHETTLKKDDDPSKLYKSDGHCIYIVHNKEINKRASDTKKREMEKITTEPFTYFFPSVSVENIEYFQNKVLKEPELRKVLAQDVPSLEDAQRTVDQALEQLTQAETYSHHCIEATLRSRESLLRNKLRIQSEAPFNKWLCDYIFGILDKSYVVEMQECNL